MRFNGISKVHQGKFISRYDISYTTEDGQDKNYEIISRDKNLKTLKQLNNSGTDGVVIIVTDKTGDRILLNREFRMAVGAFIYNFPAGLIDAGESAAVAAKRELKEETGLDLTAVEDQLFDSYSAIGFSNETNAVIIGKADGTFSPSTSSLEEISAAWYTRAEVRKLLKDQYFAARTQAYCYMWSKQQNSRKGI
ncbi:MAG: NUDIX hydrolase [Eubacteriales bacterium]|nr:NUDIX hydrolase [Eubacteriales bacterium]